MRTLHIWPALPLIIGGSMALISHADNITAVLGQSNRVREVFLSGLADSQLVAVLAAMEEPYPELTEMRLWSRAGTLSAIPVPDSFLGGSAPLLQDFSLSGIPFPGFPKLLLSATHLVYLELSNIPHSGYISPEAIVAPLSALSSLKILTLEFRSPQSRPDLETPSLPPPKRSIFPALDEFRFKGVTEYLEEFVTRIDAPQLNEMHITFFNQIVFYCPRLAQFINCTPTLRALDEAHVEFNDSTASVALRCRTSKINFGGLRIDISCREPDWQLWSIAQFCNSSLPPLSMVEHLHIVHRYSKLVWKNDATESTLWLEVLLPSTMLKNLFLHEEFAPGIADALQELIGSRITAVLPSLQNIFVKGLEPLGPYQENLRQFVAARLHSGHPISISVWDTGRM